MEIESNPVFIPKSIDETLLSIPILSFSGTNSSNLGTSKWVSFCSAQIYMYSRILETTGKKIEVKILFANYR